MDDLVKMLGSGVVGFFVGWASHIRVERSKRRRMQRNLYREIAENYGTLFEAVNLERPMNMYASRKQLPYRLQFDYFDHSQKDLDTFNEVKGFSQISDLYLALKDLDREVKGEFNLNLVLKIESLCHAIEEAAGIGLLDKADLLKHSPDWVRPILKKRIAERAEEVRELPPEW